MKLLVFMSILPAVFIIGSIDSAGVAWLGYQKENARVVPGDFLHPRSKSCTRTCCFHLGNLAIIRISGMGHYSPTTLRNSMRCTYELDNARMFSIAWALLYKDLGDRQPKLILRNRKLLKKFEEWMKDSRIEVWAEDDVHFQRASSLTRTWAPRGKQPRVLSASTREKIGFFGAVSLATGQLVTQTALTFNAETFQRFLCYLLRFTHRPILLILDNARYHRARDLNPFFTKYQAQLQRAFLSPYSPELNPIERVWRITRRKVIHNRYFASIENLKGALVNQFTQSEHPKGVLKVLCATI